METMIIRIETLAGNIRDVSAWKSDCDKESKEQLYELIENEKEKENAICEERFDEGGISISFGDCSISFYVRDI